jgi:hypothetical protein
MEKAIPNPNFGVYNFEKEWTSLISLLCPFLSTLADGRLFIPVQCSQMAGHPYAIQQAEQGNIGATAGR